MRAPRCRLQQLHLLCHHQGAELRDEALGEVGVGEHRGPMGAPGGIVVELPDMDDLIDHAGVALEVADQVLVVAALVQRREADLLVELHRLGHLADIERVGPEFIKRHGQTSSPIDQRVGSSETCTRSLPKFLPLSRPMKACGAFSMPFTISSRYLILPAFTAAGTSFRKPSIWVK